MTKHSLRWLDSFGAFAVATMVALSGCADAVTGPEEAGAMDHRVLESADGMPLHLADPFEAVENNGVQGRINHRFFLPPPLPSDSTQRPPEDRENPPISRLGQRYLPITIPPDSSVFDDDKDAGGR